VFEQILQRMQRPPFSHQTGNAQRMARLRGEIDGLRGRLTTATAAAAARDIYLGALRRAPDDHFLHENYAEFLEAMHDWKAAIAERQAVCDLIPFNYFPFYSLGVDLLESGDPAAAAGALRTAERMRPGQGDVRLELGITYARQGNWEPAWRELETAERLNPHDPHVRVYLGEVLWKLGRHDDSLAALREAVRLDASDWQPHYRLASELIQQRKFEDAANEYQETLRLNPANVRAKLGLAAAWMDLGRQPEAMQQLNEVLSTDPANQTALDMLRKINRR
jgi:tetratricopeptide (TPR) repeat protein